MNASVDTVDGTVSRRTTSHCWRPLALVEDMPAVAGADGFDALLGLRRRVVTLGSGDAWGNLLAVLSGLDAGTLRAFAGGIMPGLGDPRSPRGLERLCDLVEGLRDGTLACTVATLDTDRKGTRFALAATQDANSPEAAHVLAAIAANAR